MANVIRNGGASNTTDWINPDVDNLAEFWQHDFAAGTRTYSIVTGNGFTGDAQRCEFVYTAASGSAVLLQWATDFITSVGTGPKYYVLSFKYRHYKPNNDQPLRVSIQYTDFSFEEVATFTENTGNAITATTSFTIASGKQIRIISFVIGCSPNVASWLEIDEVDFQEYTAPTLTHQIRVGSAWKDINFTDSKIRIGSDWKDISGVKIMENGTWKTVL